MEHAEEKVTDPFNIGLYLIEAGLVGAVIYAMIVLASTIRTDDLIGFVGRAFAGHSVRAQS
jgi:hypothetical protein